MRRAALALFGVGALLLLLIAADVATPVRGFLALAFFATGPGTAIVPHLRVQDGALAWSLAVGLSLVATVAVAQAMVWMDAFSPAAAVAVLLAVMAVALRPPRRERRRARQEVAA